VNQKHLSDKLKYFASMGAINPWFNKKIPRDINLQDPICNECLIFIRQACFELGWSFSDNFAQWDYWHCMNSQGGLFPFSLDYLLEKLDEIT
jgi:hypothetical protein